MACEGHEQMVIKITDMGTRLEFVEDQIRDQRAQIDAIRNLASSIEHLSREVGRIMPLLDGFDNRLRVTEARPGKEIAAWARNLIYVGSGAFLLWALSQFPIGG